MNRKSTTEIRKRYKGTYIGIYSGVSFFTVNHTVMSGILTRCEELGVIPVVEVVSDETRTPLSVATGQVHAAIVFGHRMADMGIHLSYEIPILYVNTNLRNAPGSITFDEPHGIELGIRHLIDRGRKHLAYIYCEREHYSAEARLRAVVDTCERYHLPNPAVLKLDKELELGFSNRQMLQLIETFLKRDKKIDGVILSPDRIAPLLYTSLQSLKRKIPKDVSVIGFNNSDFTRLVSPTLSVLWPQYEQLGKQTVNLVFDALNGGTGMDAPIILQYELIERESS